MKFLFLKDGPSWGQRLRRMICLLAGHKVNEGMLVDGHGGWDAMSYCERCGEYDV